MSSERPGSSPDRLAAGQSTSSVSLSSLHNPRYVSSASACSQYPQGRTWGAFTVKYTQGPTQDVLWWEKDREGSKYGVRISTRGASKDPDPCILSYEIMRTHLWNTYRLVASEISGEYVSPNLEASVTIRSGTRLADHHERVLRDVSWGY